MISHNGALVWTVELMQFYGPEPASSAEKAQALSKEFSSFEVKTHK